MNLKQGLGKSPIGSEEWGDRLRRKARDLATRINREYMDLGEILYTVWDTPIDGDRKKSPIFTSWGFMTFSEYAEQELNLNRRTAEHLRRIYYVIEVELRGLDIQLRRRLINLGRSKARELVRVLNLQNAEEWISVAERVSYKDLLAAIKQKLEEAELSEAINGPPDQVPVPEAEQEVKRLQFALFPEQNDNVKLALSRAKELSLSEKTGHNLDLICTDFLATNDFRKGSDQRMWKRFLSKYEDMMKMHIVVIDPKTNQIWYGAEKLKAFVEAIDG